MARGDLGSPCRFDVNAYLLAYFALGRVDSKKRNCRKKTKTSKLLKQYKNEGEKGDEITKVKENVTSNKCTRTLNALNAKEISIGPN